MFHVIDDEPSMRRIMAALLNAFGHSARTFDSPHAYLQYMEEPSYEMPCAVFADISMAGMDGYEMMAQALRRRPALKFVMVSGASESRSRHQNKACMFLLKPFKPERLRALVEVLVGCHRQGPSGSNGCVAADDRHLFSLDGRNCPKGTETDA